MTIQPGAELQRKELWYDLGELLNLKLKERKMWRLVRELVGNQDGVGSQNSKESVAEKSCQIIRRWFKIFEKANFRVVVGTRLQWVMKQMGWNEIYNLKVAVRCLENESKN